MDTGGILLDTEGGYDWVLTGINWVLRGISLDTEGDMTGY